MKSCSVFILLLLAIIAGLGLGLLAGWVIWPVQWTDASPEQLRVEFQTDWVNMAIDSYSVNQNAELAAERYSYLGPDGAVILNEVIADPVWVTEEDALAFQQAVTGEAALTTTAPAEEAAETSITSRILKPPLLGYVLVVIFLGLLAIVLLVILVFRLLGGNEKKQPEEVAVAVTTAEASAVSDAAPIVEAELVEEDSATRSDLGAVAVVGGLAAGEALASDQEEQTSLGEAELTEPALAAETVIAEEIHQEIPPVEELGTEVLPEQGVEEAGGGISAGVLAAGAAAAAVGVAAIAGSDSEEQPVAEGDQPVAAETEVVAGDEQGGMSAAEIGLGAAAAGAAIAGVGWALEEPPEEIAAEELIESEAEEDNWLPEVGAGEETSDFYGKYNRKVIDIEGIGEAYAQRLAEAGITTTHALLQQCATTKGRQDLAEKTGISGKLILEWANHADMMRIQGIGPQWSDLLEMVGVNTVREMAMRNPANLHQLLVDVNAEKNLVRQLPTPAQVEDWIEQAKELPRILTY